jgi:serine phosphatase RsbU (regulator of sigma subunit)
MKLKRIIFIIAIFCITFYAKASKEEADSLINLTLKEKDDSVLLSLYNDIGSATYKLDQQLAKKYWEMAFNIATEKVKSNRSEFYLEQLSNANNGLGIISRRSGNYSEALSYYQRCLKINEETGNTDNLGFTYLNIGVIYRDLEDYDKAIEYYQKSLDIRLNGTDSAALAGCYNSFGILYRRMKELDKALEYYNKSLELSALVNDDENVAQSYNNIGVIYVMQEKYDEAIKIFNKGYDMHSKHSDQAGMVRYHANMSHVYDKLGNTTKAISEGEKAHKIYFEMGRRADLFQVASKLSHLYAKKNDYKKSLTYYKEFIALRDSVFNENTTLEIAQKEMQFEFDKKLMADSLARAEEEKIQALEYQQELSEQRMFMYGGGLILLIVLIFSIIIFNRLKITNKQKAVIEQQKLIVEEKNKEITDSITYAKRIQTAMLPSIEKIQESLPSSFVYYQPKDIVAGDFYWFMKKDNKILLAVADCTGHGVPGAMVSVVCHNALNRAVNDFNLINPAKILDKTAELVIEAFKKNNEDVKDGMDISLCSFDLENNKLEYAGAINSLFYISENKLTEVKGDKQPIGQYAKIKPFTQHSIDLVAGDKVYLFSDGYPDQFGGEKGKKFMYKRFRDLILTISDKEFSKQKNMLEDDFNHWKQDLEQLDDVCVIGVKI